MRRWICAAVCWCGFSMITPLAAGGEPGLAGYWKFDEAMGDIATDSSGNENDGQIWGAQWVRGPFGTALWFSGQDSHVAVPEIAGLDGANQLTVMAWVFWEGTGRYPNIVSGGRWSPGGFMIFVQDDHCMFRMGRPGVSAARNKAEWREVSVKLLEPLKPRRWYHLAAVFRRPTITTYVDGQSVASRQWDFPVGYSGALVIGRWAGQTAHRGLIDEVKLYKRALSADEVAAEYRRTAAGRQQPQVGAAYKKIPRQAQLARALARYQTRYAELAVSSSGRCIALIDKTSGEDRLLRSTPLVSIKQQGKVYWPTACSRRGDTLVFRFGRTSATVAVQVQAKEAYFVLAIRSVSSPDVEEVVFGKLAVKPSPYVSWMSGLAGDGRFGVCLRSLNLQTDVHVGGRPLVLEASVARQRGLTRGRAALVAAPAARLRPALQRMLVEQGVIHSKLGGPFALDAEENRGSYVFARVGEGDVDRWIQLARRGGIRTIHLNGWYKSLGHYEPREDLYTGGLAGLKRVVQRLHAAGLKVGIHTLTGCISPGDRWVRPVPDRRLATDGTFTLAGDLDEKATVVPTVAPPGNWPTVWAYSSRGNCIRIDDELILYRAVSNQSPTGFLQCRRGAFGTRAAPHKKGAPVYHMYVRYGCFVPDEHSTLVDEVAERIAEVFNTCQMDQIYMDGAEAMRGWYGIGRMRQAIFQRLNRPALVEASCWDHHSWPFHSRVGAWDHPRWGLKRFADEHLRSVEQYRRAFLLEAQLGWWVILGPSRDWDAERPDEIEYLCAKALAHDAPLSLQNVAASGRPSNARQDEYLTTIGQYERLRLANYFTGAVKQKLKAERQEFHLAQTEDGQWQFFPTDYLSHKVTGLSDGSTTWTVTNRFAPQPLRLRIQALYAAEPYDSAASVPLATFAKAGEFAAAGAAPGVRATLQPVGPDDVAIGQPPWQKNVPAAQRRLARLVATNTHNTRVGAWCRFTRHFEPSLDLRQYDAVGLWVHGDGKGELINVQLTNRPEYFRTVSDHHIKVDFRGWRYFELLLRERDAAAYHDYRWPYGAHTPLHRSPLVRQVIDKLTFYYNNLPPGEEASCYVSPPRALRVRKVVLSRPAIEIGGRRRVFPVELESGMAIELDGPDACRLYDERGQLVDWIQPQGELPHLAAGPNTVRFTCQGPEQLRSRAEVTVITAGDPIGGRNPKEQIDWSLLRRQYELPRTITAIDGRQNRWHLVTSPELGPARLEMELRVERTGQDLDQFHSPGAVSLEGFEAAASRGSTADAGGSFVYDAQPVAAGCLEGVTQQLELTSDSVKFGRTCARYTATSKRDDNRGWSVKYRRLTRPLDVSSFAAIGFWLYGDGNGQQLKLQLRDAAGGWQDMYTRVDFTGWRYCQFELGGPQLKDPKRIVSLNIYYNGIPARRTVSCLLDEIRLLPPLRPLVDPQLTIDGQTIRFPVRLVAGDRLELAADGRCRVQHAGGRTEPIAPQGQLPRLAAGRHEVLFGAQAAADEHLCAVVSLCQAHHAD